MDNAAVKVTKETVWETAREAEPLLKAIGISPETYNRIALNALMRNPSIANCSPASLRQALLVAAQRGTMPDGESAVIIPYKNKGGGPPRAGLITMFGGALDLARMAMPGLTVRMKCIYKGEDYVYQEGLNFKLEHKPNEDHGWGAENVIAAYAIGTPPGATSRDLEFMYKDEIEKKHRSHSGSPLAGVWVTEYERMCQKTVGLALLRRYPIRGGLLKAGRPADAIEDYVPGEESTSTVIDLAPQAQAAAHPQAPVPADAPPQQPSQPAAQPSQPAAQPSQPAAPQQQPQTPPAPAESGEYEISEASRF